MKIPKGFDKSNLLPAVIQDYQTKNVRMVGYMNKDSFKRTLKTGHVWFWSRSRERLWQKGESSGNILVVKQILFDCDEDALLIIAEQVGEVTCHLGRESCFEKISQSSTHPVSSR